MQSAGHVLIVDDEPHVRHFIALIVKGLGPVEIHEAESGEDALTQFESLDPKPHLVIMDISMPGIGGIEALHRLRAAGAEGAIVMLTSLATRQMVEAAINNGASAYIRKDTPKTEIAAQLEEIWKNFGPRTDPPAPAVPLEPPPPSAFPLP